MLNEKELKNRRLASKLRENNFSDNIKEYLFGSLLGDDHITKPRSGSSRLKVNHSIHQIEYVKWKMDILKEIVVGDLMYYHYLPSKKYPNGFTNVYFWTITHPEFSYFRSSFYGRKSKQISSVLINHLTPFALAIWYMDDGSFSVSHPETYKYRDVIFHTQSFNREDNEMLSQILKMKYDVTCKISNSKYPFLRLDDNDGSIDKLFNIIEPYIIPSMQYKLGRLRDYTPNI